MKSVINELGSQVTVVTRADASPVRLLTVFALLTVSGAEAVRGEIPAEATVRYEFREPGVCGYVVDAGRGAARVAGPAGQGWLAARRDGGGTNIVWLGDRVVLRLAAPHAIESLLAGGALEVSRVVASNLFVLQATDAATAAVEAARLAAQPGVEVSHPVRRRPVRLHSKYAPAPADPLFGWQWHLENRNSNTTARLGCDLNVRAAWADSAGAGVVVAMGDNGVEVSHPDLAAGMANSHHYNFVMNSASGTPGLSSQAHGTSVAGLIAARSGNAQGVVGVAPQVQLASWVVFDSFDNLTSEENVMDMFQYRSNIVSVQNHSWGNATVERLPVSALEAEGIDNALEHGRGGRGSVIVRAAGNEREYGNDVNDEGYAQDPRVITVGAVRTSGRATTYSTPGATILVAAFSGDDAVDLGNGTFTNYALLTTTDRQGSLGYNTVAGGMGNYAYGSTGFNGTSGATPQIAGLCALILAANPNLTYRDVQAVLVLAARQLDAADPGIRTNAAGFAFSHNVGFGVPDAGLAVQLARGWTNRPALVGAAGSVQKSVDIPDDGLRVRVTGPDVPSAIVSIPAYPTDGLHPDDPTLDASLVDVGQASNPILADLTGRGALIQRGVNYFVQKLRYAAAARAAFAIVYNNTGTTDRVYMGGDDLQFVPLPAVFIDRTSGEALRAYIASQPTAQAQLGLLSATFDIPIASPLVCEYARLHVRASHPRRADIRVTLVSPAGTRSVLHHWNQDTASSFGDWDFYTRAPFGESSAGTWRVEVSDESPGYTGRVTSLALTVYGVAIHDDDRDGLDDAWETRHFGSLAAPANADPDGDGFNNAREQILGWNPLVNDRPMSLDVDPWKSQWLRLSWPASGEFRYELLSFANADGPVTAITPLSGQFPELEAIVPAAGIARRFFQVRQTPLEANGP